MSLLAEPKKRKRKAPTDPRNKFWRNDEDAVGQKMLKRLGWAEGKGLGRQEQGNPDPIKLKANVESRGLGAQVCSSDAWIGHQESYAELLKSLNEQQGKAGVSESEGKSAALSSRGRYSRFVRGKDLSGYSSEDVASILGSRRHVAPVVACPSQADIPSEDASQLSVSQLSSADYFAAKLREKLKRLS